MASHSRILLSLAAVALGGPGEQARAAQIWTGPPTVFSKPAFADPDDPANQDRITSNVWLTRADTRGIYNAQAETAYEADISPADTRWAYGTTAMLDSLAFSVWKDAVAANPPTSVGQDMVLHLITDDIYLDVVFLSWGQRLGGGGSFSYQRATPGTARPGDFNGDTLADAADYTIWRDNLGGDDSVLHGGGDSDGVVDSGDYGLWREGFGRPQSALAPVRTPEPGGLSLLGMATLIALRRIRRG